MFSQKFIPQKRSQEQRLRKKMTNGIVGLTRPRFGKRSSSQIPESAKNFSNLKRPRFGKRIYHGPINVLKFLYSQYGKRKRVPENFEESDNKIEEEEIVR